MLGYIESFLIFTFLYLILYQTRWKKKDPKSRILYSILYIYLFLVLCVTILPIDFTLDPKWNYHSSIKFTYVHIKPFHDLIAGYSGAVKQILLNIVMTVPFGFLYASITKKPCMRRMILSTFLFSFGIEMIQLLMTVFLLHYRSCDVTDIITNILGGIIGYLLYQLLKNKL